MRHQFLQPLRAVFDLATTRRKCPAEPDWDWLTKGVDRVLSTARSGRDFLQSCQLFWTRELQVGLTSIRSPVLRCRYAKL